MTKINWSVAISLMIMAQMLAGCASSAEQAYPPYEVGAGSAIYAGSSMPADKTKASVDLYFGSHGVRSGGNGRGCCFSTGMAGGNSGRPRGAVLALWTAGEYGEEKVFSETHQAWLAERIDRKFYYAVAQQARLAPYPAKSTGHRSYGIYVSAGRVVVNEAGLPPEDSRVARKPVAASGAPAQYVLGRDDALYYKILSHGSDVPSVADDPSPWNEIPGVAIIEKQYFELRKCSPALDCRWFLGPNDPDLTPEQREYVRQNPIFAEDMKPLIKDLERSRRQHNRWL